ncbi:MAG: type I CRISPR-associated protein Cas7, partial [Oscillospiraceae bacterium]|nr:type I CRISPR-associated protein Cas7 [Oscillospiraceae bacterium]
FSDDDLEVLWTAIINMFELDHSAARGKMIMRRLYVFKHDNVLGCAPSGVLFDLIKVEEKEPGKPPRAFGDYAVTVDENTPQGVELIQKL